MGGGVCFGGLSLLSHRGPCLPGSGPGWLREGSHRQSLGCGRPPPFLDFFCDIGSGKVTRGWVWLDPSRRQTHTVELALTPDPCLLGGGMEGQASSQAAVTQTSDMPWEGGAGQPAPQKGRASGRGAGVGSAALWPFTRAVDTTEQI